MQSKTQLVTCKLLISYKFPNQTEYIDFDRGNAYRGLQGTWFLHVMLFWRKKYLLKYIYVNHTTHENQFTSIKQYLQNMHP